MKSRSVLWKIGLVTAATLFIAATFAGAAEFTAVQTSRLIPESKLAKEKIPKSQLVPATNTVYVKAEKDRLESKTAAKVPGGAKGMTVIRLPKKGLVLILFPENKSYQERRVPVADSTWASMLKSMKRVGSEKIAGLECEKYEKTEKIKDYTVTSTLWWSPKLSYALKAFTKGPDYSTEVLLSGIKERPVAASLFELPKGYKKVNVKPVPPAKKPAR